ncbi:MAG: zinc ribbon domain-containing protein [Candidatus Zixiibacteriota bacterium]|nr:MAG: zinc ribbon domain-containing protein [candidate division Zixibacteria bacterium]
MPTYQYRCSDCDHEFEEFQAISDPPITICPSCNGKTERVISGGAGLIFKGSGFYITDYRSKDYKAQADKDRAAGTKTPDKKPSDSKAPESKKSSGPAESAKKSDK